MPRIRSSSLFGSDELVDVLEADSRRVIKIWWALAWRAVFGIVCGSIAASGVAFIATALLGMVGAVLRLPGGTMTVIAQAFGVVVTILAALVATVVSVGLVLRKEFRGFRVVLVQVKPSESLGVG